ncbi:MAG: hypothetical protein LBM21_00865 [Coriobacteriales bacterium]|nr:hypothetical protein [Coriobacteriales bacterium]
MLKRRQRQPGIPLRHPGIPLRHPGLDPGSRHRREAPLPYVLAWIAGHAFA